MCLITTLNEAEEALTRLATEIQKQVKDGETRKEYFTLLQQACVAVNKIRSGAEMSDWFKKFDWSSIR